MAVLSDALLSGEAAKARERVAKPSPAFITLRAQPKNRRASQATRIDFEFWLASVVNNLVSRVSLLPVPWTEVASFTLYFFYWHSVENRSNLVMIFAGELNELVREKDLLSLERKCEHHATETAINNAREMQKQAAKSAKDAGKNKGIRAISKKVVDKNVHATIAKGNMGYDKYTVPDTVAVKTSFAAFL